MVDCGVFLLLYAEIFINCSTKFFLDKKISTRSEKVSNLFPFFQVDSGKPKEMRKKIVRIIDKLTSVSNVSVESDESEIECLEVVMKPKRKYKRKTGNPDKTNGPNATNTSDKVVHKESEQNGSQTRLESESSIPDEPPATKSRKIS